MKRDWELVRTILTRLEAIKTHAAAVVAYHLKLLNDAGLIEAAVITLMSEPLQAIGKSLTWQGHELLDAIRRDVVKKAAGVVITNMLS